MLSFAIWLLRYIGEIKLANNRYIVVLDHFFLSILGSRAKVPEGLRNWMPMIGLPIFLSMFLSITGCAVSPTHPSLSDGGLPELIPVRKFVANIDANDGYKISPDGKKMTWIGVSMLRSAIIWRDLELDKEVALRFKKNAPQPIWAADSVHLLYHHDPSGRENYHVFAVDTRNGNRVRRDLTPYPGVKAFVARVPIGLSEVVYIMHNRRDPAVFDLYRVNLGTGQEQMIYKNTENIIDIRINDEGEIRARIRQSETARLLEVPDAAGNWKPLITASKFDRIAPIELSLDGLRLYLLTNVGRDKLVFAELNLNSGEQTILQAHKDVDINSVLTSPKDRRPLIAFATPDYPELIFFDDLLKQRLTQFIGDKPLGVNVMSLDREERFATVATWDQAGGSYYLVDLVSGESELLGEDSSRKRKQSLVEGKPISFTASDGMQLHGYLSMPKSTSAKPVPTVLLVHGGPWARDWWGYSKTVQLYANRGYAVLQINYRGSSGYGRQYMDAAVGEFAGGMHQDLIDGVDWAVANGYTDPNRVAIVGGSYGGYATLVGMTMTPGKFACGVDNVGVADLASLIESAPPYWKPWMHLWHRFVGDPADPTQRDLMDAKSPINYSAQVQGPLLIYHGANDPRVKLDQSVRMVEALTEAGKEVEFVVIKGEGHGYGHWKNQLGYYRKVEDFLAECLGGRSSGFDFFQLGSWAF